MPPGLSKAMSLGSELVSDSKTIMAGIDRQSIDQIAQRLLSGGELEALPKLSNTIKNSDLTSSMGSIPLPAADEVFKSFGMGEHAMQPDFGQIARMALETEKKGEVAKAYKTLTADGRSPFAPNVQWSLPRKGEDGKWIPGQWKDWEHAPLALAPGGERPGLYVSSNGPWMTLHIPKSRYFEAEIGDAASLAKWKKEPSGDFAAKKVRLLKELTQDEAMALLSKR